MSGGEAAQEVARRSLAEPNENLCEGIVKCIQRTIELAVGGHFGLVRSNGGLQEGWAWYSWVDRFHAEFP